MSSTQIDVWACDVILKDTLSLQFIKYRVCTGFSDHGTSNRFRNKSYKFLELKPPGFILEIFTKKILHINQSWEVHTRNAENSIIFLYNFLIKF